MRVEEYLSRVGSLNIKIQHKEQELRSVRRSVSGYSSPSYEERVKTSIYDVMGGKIAVKCDAEREIIEKISLYYAEKNRIIDEIHSLKNPVHIRILYLRYVNGYNLRRISRTINYSYGRTQHLFRDAIDDFYKNVLEGRK